MKVIHFIATDYGAAYPLHKGLRRLGFDSAMFVAQRRTDDPAVTVFQPPTDLASRLRRRLRSIQINRSAARYRNSRPAGYGWFFDDRNPYGGDALAQVPPCDVLHLHTMLNMVDYRAFFATVAQHTPVLRTLHDMSFFTGGCQCDVGCGKYTESCGTCPQLGSNDDQDLSRQIWQRKQSALNNVPPDRLYFVAPSRWLAGEARRSSLLRHFPVSVIPLGLDTEIFCPRDRGFARDVLGLPHDAAVILFVASFITRPEKGFVLLAQALDELRHLPNLVLVTVGSGKPPVKVEAPHVHLGPISNNRLLSLVYSAADIFVIPSVQDNFPYVALEAVACGTPVVGFAVGGIPEIVRPGITGALAPAQDVIALRRAICELIQDPRQRAEIAANCRRIAVEEYTLEVQARRYIELYQTIVESALLSAKRAAPASAHDSQFKDSRSYTHELATSFPFEVCN